MIGGNLISGISDVNGADGGDCPLVVDSADNPLQATLVAGELVANDDTFNIYVNGILNQTFSNPAFEDATINITA